MDEQCGQLTCKLLRNHKQIMPLWALGMERLVDSKVFLLQRKDLLIVDIRKD